MQHKSAIILLFSIGAGVIGGIVCGWYWGKTMLQFAWLGTLFLNALKMMIVPLIIAAIISGIASMGNIKKVGRLGAITLFYYISTTAISVLIGLVMVNIIQPGKGLEFGGGKLLESITAKQDTGISDIVLSMVSPNIVESASKTQLLPVIIFSIIFAMALITLGERGAPAIKFFDAVNEAMMKIITWIMYFAPIGIFALISGRFGKAGGGEAFLAEAQAVGWHMVTVLSGLLIHFFVLFAILFFIANRGWGYFIGMLRALVTAFATASSSATPSYYHGMCL